jgi:hypothetical protein
VAVLGQQRLDLLEVDQAAQQVRGLALLGIGLQPALETLEQQRRGAGGGDPRVGVGGGEPMQLAVEHEARACLEDVVVETEQSHVAREPRARAPGHHDDRGPGPVARLERAQSEEREAAVAVARHRPAGAEQRPVEVDVQAAHAEIVAGLR